MLSLNRTFYGIEITVGLPAAPAAKSLNRTFYGIEIRSVPMVCVPPSVLIVPFMELKSAIHRPLLLLALS